MKARQVIVTQKDRSTEVYLVTAYEYVGGALVLHLADEDTGRACGLETYAPGTVLTTTEWAPDENEHEDEPAHATFKVGKTTVAVEQMADGCGILLHDADNGWSLMQLRPDGVHLCGLIGQSAGFELEYRDGVAGCLKTRCDI